MKIRISEATPLQIDWLVAKCEGKDGVLHDDGITRCIVIAAPSGVYKGTWRPSLNWSQAGPIIEREKLDAFWNADAEWWSVAGYDERADREVVMRDKSYLVAAMRCYVASKLGDTVDIPEELV